MLKRFLKKKAKSDRGASSLISFILLVPLFLGLVITAVDLSFYFSNRAQVEAVARDAARTVAIFGGSGNSTKATSIEANYGVERADVRRACSSDRADITDAPNKYIYLEADKSTYSSVECNTLAALANNTGLVSISVDFKGTSLEGKKVVECGPEEATSVGSRTYCTIRYIYSGMPGAPLSFVQMRQDDGSSAGMFSRNIVTKSSESEVASPGLSNRPIS